MRRRGAAQRRRAAAAGHAGEPPPGGLLRGSRRRDAGTRPHRQGDPADRCIRLRDRGHRAPPGGAGPNRRRQGRASDPEHHRSSQSARTRSARGSRARGRLRRGVRSRRGTPPRAASGGDPERADIMSRRSATGLRTVHAPWRAVIRSFAFVRKEIVEIIRQPRLIALLVIGPFALLLLFGAGYAQNVVVKKALFVGPPGSIYEELHESYQGDLAEFIDSEGMVASEDEARAALADGKVDIVVVFPPDPQQAVLNGDRAVIKVLHDEIDPIQEAALEFAAELAIHEVNAAVLSTLAADAQSELGPVAALSASLQEASRTLVTDPVATREQLSAQLAAIDDALAGSANIISRLDTEDPELVSRVEAARATASSIVTRLQEVDEDTTDEELAALAASMDELATALQQSVMLDPEVIVQPFESDTENVVSDSITPTDYFTPSSVALLLQHLALTFAALSIVRDRRTGLFELMRVGPLSSIEIILGKTFAYLLVGTVVGAALLGATAIALGVPIAG